jgi:hypothetical protein
MCGKRIWYYTTLLYALNIELLHALDCIQGVAGWAAGNMFVFENTS